MPEYTLDNLSTRLYRASLYVEDLKYRGGPQGLTAVTRDDMIGQARTLLEDAGIRHAADPKGLVYGSAWIGKSFANALHIHPAIAESAFLDGLLHGIAYAANLSGPSRDKVKVNLDL